MPLNLRAPASEASLVPLPTGNLEPAVRKTELFFFGGGKKDRIFILIKKIFLVVIRALRKGKN